MLRNQFFHKFRNFIFIFFRKIIREQLRRFGLNINSIYFSIIISNRLSHNYSFFWFFLKNFIKRIKLINSPKRFHMHLARSNLFFWASFSQFESFLIKVNWCNINQLIIIFRLSNSFLCVFKCEPHEWRVVNNFLIFVKCEIGVHKLTIQCRQQRVSLFMKLIAGRVGFFSLIYWGILSVEKLGLVVRLIH